MSIGSKNRILVAVGLLAVMAISFQAQASHFRFGHATWTRVGGNTVDVTITEGWRAAAVAPLTWNRGDGSGTWRIPTGNVIATGTDIAGENWTLVQATFRHTYATEGPFTVSAGSCCRIYSLQNAGGANELLEMVIDLRNSNGGSPVSSVPIIVPMGVNALNNFQLPIADPDSDSFTVRMSTSAESQIPSIAAKTNTLSVSSSGLLTWDTAGSAIGQKFAVQVMIEEDNSDVRVPLDFIIEIVTVVKAIPTCSSNGAINTIVNVGTPVSITFTGTDSEGDDLTVTHLGLPTGATLTPASGTTGASPLAATFNWTPAAADSGTVFAGTIIFTESVFGLAGSCGFTITIPSNQAPTADAGPDQCVAPGDLAILDGSGSSDPDGDALSFSWVFDSTPGGSTLVDGDIADATTDSPSFVPDVVGDYVLELTVDDGNGATDTDTVTVNANLGPEVLAGLILITDGVTPLETGGSPTNVTFDATVSDSGRGEDTITGAFLTVDGGAPIPMDAFDAAYDSVTEDVTLTAGLDALGITEAGVYQVCIYAEDSKPLTGPESCTLLVVYDPSAGFVTGGGFIHSPAGAYLVDVTLEGFANFGFVAKYKKGATTPIGSTEFQFHAGDLNFHSTSYDWLVVAGKTKAMFKGVGTINGAGPFKFQLTAGDGRTTSTDDTFRIRIFDGIGTVYDNQIGDDENGDATTAIASGSIVIHTKK